MRGVLQQDLDLLVKLSLAPFRNPRDTDQVLKQLIFLISGHNITIVIHRMSTGY